MSHDRNIHRNIGLISIYRQYIVDITDFFTEFSLKRLSIADIVSIIIDIQYIDDISTDISDIFILTPSTSLDWVVDLGASQHVTMDFAALTLHARYIASDNVIIGDGSGLSIVNIGSFFLTSLPTPLFFY